jgi:hypothetical protein
VEQLGETTMRGWCRRNCAGVQTESCRSADGNMLGTHFVAHEFIPNNNNNMVLFFFCREIRHLLLPHTYIHRL